MKKKTLIIALLLVVVTMGIGFSILSTNLKIQGTAKVDNSFDVEIVGIKKVEYGDNFFGSGIGAAAGLNYSTGTAREVSEPTYTATTANFNVKMGLDSSITYLVTIENKGTIAAQFKDVVINTSEDSDVEVTLPINIDNKSLGIGEKAYVLVRIAYPYSDDLKGNDSEISIDFNAQQLVGEEANPVPYYIVTPGYQYYNGTNNPIEVVGLESSAIDEGIFNSDNGRLQFYESIDGGDFTAISNPDKYTFVNKLENFAGIDYLITDDLKDGNSHIIKIKLYDKENNYYTNELIRYYTYTAGNGS